jgi:hypothetical protein
MAIVADADILDFLNIAEDQMAYTMRDHVESVIQNYCRRTFESTTYSKERYNGTGTKKLSLRQSPIVSLDRLSIGVRDVLRVKNTSEYSMASISVTNTGIRLVKDGIANVTVTFENYTTLATLASAISAIGNGWEAVVVSSQYNNFSSQELLEVMGLNAISSNWVYLSIPEDAEYSFEVDKAKGIIYRGASFPVGFRNIIIDYEAGYASAAIPADLALAIKIATKFFYQKWKEESWNTRDFKISDLNTSFDSKHLPRETLMILSKYRRIMV